jgi:hypothetical protein
VSPRPAAERGQASVEVAAGAVVVVLIALLALQALAAGYAAVMADHAAEAAALALANGKDAPRAAAAAVPGWPRRATRVEVDGGTVRVTLLPPSPFASIGRLLAASGQAHVRRPGGGAA